MSDLLRFFVHMPVHCPTCRKRTMETFDEMISNIQIYCGHCNSKIDISSEVWRAFLEEFASVLAKMKRLPPERF